MSHTVGDLTPDLRCPFSTDCRLLECRAVGLLLFPMLTPCSLFSRQNMALPSVMVLPMLIVVAAGLYYIYKEVMQFMSKSLVRNKVVVITDAVTGVGTGK